LRGLGRAVAAATGEIVTLTTPNDLFMQILDVAGPPPTSQPTERGLRVSVFGSAVGAAYLATLSDAEIERLADRGRLPPAEIAEVLASAARIRAEGFAEGPSPDEAFWSMAAPLPAQGLPLVLGLAGPTSRVQARSGELQAIMRAAIERWLAGA
jgi:DNA-binding IclR family transcriptional regulator